MTTKKLLIVANNCENWRTWNDKIQTLKMWFAPKLKLEVTLVHTKYQNIPFIQYENPVADQAQYKNRLGVDYGWYDTYVSPMAANFDIVLFAINMSQWPKSGDMRGWRVDNTYGAIELQIGVGENETLFWGSRAVGDMFFNLARHEMMHALFMITGQNDSTHYWWNQAPEKLDNALAELQFVDPKEADEISRLEKIINFLKTLIGLQTQVNKLKMEEQKQKLPTKKDFCLAIQEYEGYLVPGTPGYPKGSLAWINKNPGNLKYANQIGSIGQNKGFAVFPDYATGFAALMRQVDAACTGRSKVFSPEMTILAFFNKYAPSIENDPTAYAKFVAKKLGVDPSFVIKNLL